MALNKTGLKDTIQTELNKLEWNSSAQQFEVDGTQYDTAEWLAKVISESIIDEFEANGVINITDVQSGTDTATGTIT